MRLSREVVAGLPVDVARYTYDRDAQQVGIVHLGIGAFHRAHQAVYTDRAMSCGDRDWAICGVSLRSPAVRDQLAPQDGLYSVTERQGESAKTAIIGAVRSVLVASKDGAAVANVLAAPATKIVSLTVTEKGYYTAIGGGLAVDVSEVADDLTSVSPSRTIYGLLAAGLARRRDAGLPGLTLISCDNLAENGALLRAHLSQFLDLVDPSLRAWFEAECATPATMIDRIVPATTTAQIDALDARLGCRDEAAVLTEPFSQWVIEDRFAGPRPRWELAGAQFVDDVRPFEVAKLRMLNGAHSALAYLGLSAGHTYVHQAISDPAIAPLIEQLMVKEAAPTLPPTAGLEPHIYAGCLRERFANAALEHRLDQIAMDGSQKIPQRWLATLKAQQSRGIACDGILTALAAWIRYLRDGKADDPLAEPLAALWRSAGENGIVEALFGGSGFFAKDWIATDAERDLLSRLVKQGEPRRSPRFGGDPLAQGK